MMWDYRRVMHPVVISSCSRQEEGSDLRFWAKLKLKVTRKNSISLPGIDDSLDKLAEAKYFSTVDSKSGY
jgi:hypothetical protein